MNIFINIILLILIVLIHIYKIETFDENKSTLLLLKKSGSKNKTYDKLIENIKKNNISNKINIEVNVKNGDDLSEEEKKIVNYKPDNKIQDWTSIIFLNKDGKIISRYYDSLYIEKELVEYIENELNKLQ